MSVDTVGRYIGRIAVDTRSIYRPSVGRYTVEYRSSVSRVPVEYRPILRPICVSADTVLFSSTLGRYLIDTLPIVYRYLTDTRSIPYRYSDQVRRPSRYVSVDMSVVNCPTISYNILLLSVDIKEIFNQFRK